MSTCIPETTGTDSFSKWLDEFIDSMIMANPAAAQSTKRETVKAACIEIAKIVSPYGFNIVLILGMLAKKKPALLLTKPEAFVRLATETGRHAGFAFNALSSDKIYSTFASNPENIIASFVEIIKIISRTGDPTAANAAFLLLTSDRFAEFFTKNKRKFVKICNEISESVTGEVAYAIFIVLRNDEIATSFFRNPNKILSVLYALSKLTDKKYAVLLFGVMTKPKVAGWFSRKPDVLLKAIQKMTKTAGGQSSLLFSLLLENGKIAYKLEIEPEKTINELLDLTKISGKQTGAVASMFRNRKILDIFVNDRRQLFSAIKTLALAAGKNADSVFDIVASTDGLVDEFAHNPKMLADIFGKVITAVGEEKLVYGLLKSSAFRSAFTRDPQQMATLLTELSKDNKKNTQRIIELILTDTTVSLFEKNMENKIRLIAGLAKAGGKNVGNIMALLQKEALNAEFARDPEKMAGTITELITASGKNAPLVLKLLQNDKMVQLFACDSVKTSRALVKVASSGKYAPKLLEIAASAELASYLIEKNSVSDIEEISNVMLDIVKVAGENASAVLELFESNEIKIKLIEQRYTLLRALQVVEGSAELKGSATGLMFSIIRNNDIAPIFAQKPLEIVNKFRAVLQNMTIFPKEKPESCLDAIRKSSQVKKAFAEYCKVYMGGNEEMQIMEKQLLPALKRYFEA